MSDIQDIETLSLKLRALRSVLSTYSCYRLHTRRLIQNEIKETRNKLDIAIEDLRGDAETYSGDTASDVS